MARADLRGGIAVFRDLLPSWIPSPIGLQIGRLRTLVKIALEIIFPEFPVRAWPPFSHILPLYRLSIKNNCYSCAP